MNTIKTYIVILFSLFLLQDTFAQRDGQYLSDSDFKLSAFGDYMIEFSFLGDELGVSTGGGIAALFNQSWYIGGYRLSSANDITVFNDLGISSTVNYQHTGLWVGYFFTPKQLVHIGFSAKGGWGSMSFDGVTAFEDNLFAITPQLEANVNIARWCRLGFGAGYRITTGVDNPFYTAQDFNSPVGTVNIMIGWFGQNTY